MLEPRLIEGFSRKSDRAGSFRVGEMLSFTVGALDEDPGHAALGGKRIGL